MSEALRPGRWRHLRIIVAVLAGLPLLAACSAQGAAVSETTDPQPAIVDLGGVPAPANTAPLWQKTFDAPVQISLAPDGSVATALAPGGLRALGPDGSVLWRAGTGGVAIALQGGLVVRGPAPTDNGGQLRLYDSAGNLIWQQPGVGPITAVASPDGNRVAIADDGAGQVWLVDSNPADAPADAASLPIAGPAALHFTGSDQLVMDDGTQVSVVAPSGAVKPLCPGGCSGPSRSIAAASNASWLAVATRGGDNTLYMFKRDGTALWHRSLPSGGQNRLAVGPKDRRVLLYDLGTAGGLAEVSTSTGLERWAVNLQAGGAAVPAVAATFLPSGGVLVLAQNASACYVVALDAFGNPLAALPLLAGATVDLTGTRDAALVATDNTTGSASVDWYSLKVAGGS